MRQAFLICFTASINKLYFLQTVTYAYYVHLEMSNCCKRLLDLLKEKKNKKKTPSKTSVMAAHSKLLSQISCDLSLLYWLHVGYLSVPTALLRIREPEDYTNKATIYLFTCFLYNNWLVSDIGVFFCCLLLINPNILCKQFTVFLNIHVCTTFKKKIMGNDNGIRSSTHKYVQHVLVWQIEDAILNGGLSGYIYRKPD